MGLKKKVLTCLVAHGGKMKLKKLLKVIHVESEKSQEEIQRNLEKLKKKVKRRQRTQAIAQKEGVKELLAPGRKMVRWDER